MLGAITYRSPIKQALFPRALYGQHCRPRNPAFARGHPVSYPQGLPSDTEQGCSPLDAGQAVCIQVCHTMSPAPVSLSSELALFAFLSACSLTGCRSCSSSHTMQTLWGRLVYESTVCVCEPRLGLSDLKRRKIFFGSWLLRVHPMAALL